MKGRGGGGLTCGRSPGLKGHRDWGPSARSKSTAAPANIALEMGYGSSNHRVWIFAVCFAASVGRLGLDTSVRWTGKIRTFRYHLNSLPGNFPSTHNGKLVGCRFGIEVVTFHRTVICPAKLDKMVV
jgi:hypothetical protein